MKITLDRIKEILKKIEIQKVLVAGDFFLDAYWYYDSLLSKPSKETGLLNMPITKKEYSLGGASNVTWNVKDLGINEVFAVTVLGHNDEFYPQLSNLFVRYGINTNYIIKDEDRSTPTYIKMINKQTRKEETSRVDILNNEPLSSATEQKLIQNLESCLKEDEIGAVILCDQVENPTDKKGNIERYLGVFTPNLFSAVNSLAQAYPNIPFLVDSRNKITNFKGMIWKTNLEESILALNQKSTKENPENIAKLLYEISQKPVYLTLGERGIVVANSDCYDPLFSYTSHVPPIPVEGEIDPVGAGDTMIASLASSLAAGATPKEAALFSIIGPAITIKKLHTTGTATPQEILELAKKHYK